MSGLYTALVVTALGTGVNQYSQNQNLKNQDNQAAASIRNQMTLNNKAESDVNTLNQSVARSNPQDAQKAQDAAYVAAIRNASATQGTVNPAVKGASKRYGDAVAGSQADVNNYARSTANNLAATVAPQLQRIGEGNQIADTASQLGIINDASNSEQGLLRTRLAGDAANPWLSSLGTILQGTGQGLATNAGYKKGGQGMGGSNPYLH